jgi:hypothetical protein
MTENEAHYLYDKKRVSKKAKELCNLIGKVHTVHGGDRNTKNDRRVFSWCYKQKHLFVRAARMDVGGKTAWKLSYKLMAVITLATHHENKHTRSSRASRSLSCSFSAAFISKISSALLHERTPSTLESRLAPKGKVRFLVWKVCGNSQPLDVEPGWEKSI